MSGLKIELVTHYPEWEALSLQWNNLLDSSGTASFFLSWEWLWSWANVCLDAERKLFILVVYDKDEIVAIAPFYIIRNKYACFYVNELRFLGTPESGSDYLDVIVKKGHERDVALAIYAYLNGDGSEGWDKLVLSDIPSNSLFLLHFMNCFEAEGKHAEVTRSAYCPIVHLPESEDALYASMSKGWRKKFKQDMRVARRDYDLSHTVYQGHDISPQLNSFFDHYEKKGGWSGDHLNPLVAGLLTKYQSSPPLQLDCLTIDGTLLAALLHFRFKETMSMYLMAVDKKSFPKISVGNLLVGHSIVNAIHSGFRFYDFLKGEERYKFHWSNTGQATLKLSAWQNRPSGYCPALVQLMKYSGKVLLR